MANIPLLIAQVSSILTSIAGLIALAFIVRSTIPLARDKFRTGIILTGLFVLLTLIGVTSMTLYHATDGTDATEEFRESAENYWYVFMFAGFLFYCFESLYVASFGAHLRSADIVLSKMKKKR